MAGAGRAAAAVRDPSASRPHWRGEPNEDWFRGNRWPPQDLPELATDLRRRTLANTPVVFRPEDWSFAHFAVVATTQFAQQTMGGGTTPAWTGIAIPPPPAIPAVPPALPALTPIEKELAELIEIAEFRAGVMAEAMEQRDNVLGYFRGVLTFKGTTHPWTTRLAHAAIRVGQFLVMHHKMQHARPRPSRLFPALMPPVDPPGHAAYPSGHATEAYLLALVLGQVMPGPACGEGVGGARVPVTEADALHPSIRTDITKPVRDLAGIADLMENTPLWRIAERIARNREVIGVHYPSRQRGRAAAGGAGAALLLACPLIGAPVTGAIARAKAEWA